MKEDISRNWSNYIPLTVLAIGDSLFDSPLDYVRRFDVVYSRYIRRGMTEKDARFEAVKSVLLPRLTKLLRRNSDPAVRRGAAEALGEYRDVEAVKPLIVALNDENASVRETAAWALQRIGHANAIKPLVALLYSENGELRNAAVKALREIKDPSVVAPLVKILLDPNKRRHFTDFILRRSPRISPSLRHHVRYLAASVLEELGWNPPNDSSRAIFIVAKRDWDAAAALQKAAIGPLIEALTHFDSEVRRDAARTLGKIASSEAVQDLVNLVHDDSPRVRVAAVEALGRVGDPVASQTLKAALKDADDSVRTRAAEALERIERISGVNSHDS